MSNRMFMPDNEAKNEMAGRMYNAIDVLRGIESGKFKSVEDIKQSLTESSSNLSALIKCDVWKMDDANVCVDINKSLATQKFVDQQIKEDPRFELKRFIDTSNSIDSEGRTDDLKLMSF